MILTAVHLRKDPASDIPMREMWKIKGYLTDGNLRYRRWYPHQPLSTSFRHTTAPHMGDRNHDPHRLRPRHGFHTQRSDRVVAPPRRPKSHAGARQKPALFRRLNRTHSAAALRLWTFLFRGNIARHGCELECSLWANRIPFASLADFVAMERCINLSSCSTVIPRKASRLLGRQ